MAPGLSAMEQVPTGGFQLRHGLGASTTGGLVGGDHHTAQGGQAAQGGQGQQQQDGGAVGVGNHAQVPAGRVQVHLRHHQRHLGIQTKGAGVVNQQRSMGCHDRSPLTGDGSTCGGQHQVNIGQCLLGHRLHRQTLATKGESGAGRAGGSQQLQAAQRKSPLLQQQNQLTAHGARGAQHSNSGGAGAQGGRR